MDRGDGTEEIERVGLHPFEVFPEELWPEIIEKLKDSAEILKVMEAIPEIKDIMESRKRWWLFDQVIPHVSHWLSKTDFLSSRLVCKLWSHGVDNLLENHPRYRAYNPEEPVTGQVWIYDMKPGSSSAWNFLSRMPFNRNDKLLSFLQETKGHPKERSSILGRGVHLNTQEGIEVLNGASKMFQSLGQHIRFLTLEDYRHTDPIPFSNSILEWISLLPNLKSFKLQLKLMADRSAVLDGFLNVTYVDDDEEFFANADKVGVGGADQESPSPKEEEASGSDPDPWMESLPPLPHLETLQFHFDTLPPSMVNALMSSYSLPIRRLWTPLRYWKPEYSSMFPNLTELTFEYVFSLPRLIHILLNIEAPLLYDLELWFTDTPEQLDVEADILPWLKRFPEIRNLTLLADGPLPGTDVLINPEIDSVPSLKYLSVPETFLHANSDLLLCFPNLEFLELGDSTYPEDEAYEPTLEIWENIEEQTIYESNVWELLPNLKVISLFDSDTELDDPEIRFTREIYEFEEKLADEDEASPSSN